MPVYLLLIFFSVFLLTILSLNFFRKKLDPSTQRLRRLNGEDATPERKRVVRKKASAGLWLDQLLNRTGGLYHPDSHHAARLQRRLNQAGFVSEKSVRLYIAIKIGLALLFALVYGLLAAFTGRSMGQVLAISLLMAFLALALPDIVLRFKIRTRQRLIAAGLPDALDLLVISVEAGLGLNAALLRVGQDIRLRSLPLSEELLLVNQEMRTGFTREKALRRLAERNKVESLRILVGALVLADRLGTSIADTLRTQADSLRTRVRQAAEEQAAKAGVKMLLPLVLFILPALFIVLLGPGAITLTKSFSQLLPK
ncbi:MAG TPA: type II secretion system F family protein [bacterium]|nr:type II secretion system F family protein [bacterium]HPN34929.1 type II secretion system F family protein [bacterium]